jgi:NAD(P)-dependent dehydrogenase (short-subunit alcohol dehydrogenase family)
MISSRGNAVYPFDADSLSALKLTGPAPKSTAFFQRTNVFPMKLKSKVALITGAGSGIGAAIARRFASEGASVWLLDRDVEAAESVVQSIRDDGGDAHAAVCDVAQESSVASAVASLPKVDIAVNNAGISHVGTVETTTGEDMDRVYSVNIKGVFHISRAVVPRMLEQGGGVLLNLCSVAAKLGIEARFAYSMTKGAVLAMTLQMARDYVAKNIRCNCICPARVHTPFVDGYLAAHYPGREREMFEKLSAWQPIGRMGKPEEVAALAAFLCSDEASFITGSAYDLDGGTTLLR